MGPPSGARRVERDAARPAKPIVHAGSRDRLLGSAPSDELLQHYSMQLQVRADTPATFLLHAADDELF